MNTAVPDRPGPVRLDPARTGRRPDRATARRAMARHAWAGVALGTTSLVGVAALAMLCWSVEAAAALPARLLGGAPWPVPGSLAALMGVLAVVHLRGLSGGRWVWWSRLSWTVIVTAAAVELVLRGWHLLGALAAAGIAVAAIPAAALAVHPKLLGHHLARLRARAIGSSPPRDATSQAVP
ncbi:hypothetical protein AB0A63_31480 [Lentzea sp. NPDC042327]|uniref:hypothetical protein n=1 Tax=Lentzea sp. NPDC042327 TaxID=3154801 RepID=UPI00340963A2